MKKILTIIPALALVLLASPVFARTEVEGDAPSWYFLFEIVGSLISLLALVGLLRISRLMGGAIGRLLTTISIGMAFITAALLLRSYFEWIGSETFRADLAFELSLYFGLTMIFIGVEIAIRRIKKIKASGE